MGKIFLSAMGNNPISFSALDMEEKGKKEKLCYQKNSDLFEKKGCSALVLFFFFLVSHGIIYFFIEASKQKTQTNKKSKTNKTNKTTN